MDWSFFSDYTLRIVMLGSSILGIVSGVVGSFAVLKKQGLIGDAISHASLPGIAIAFLLIGAKSTTFFMIGALIVGLMAVGLILVIEKYSRIKIDSAMAIVLSSFFGFGLVLLTYIQKIPNANQAGLEKFIFGQASSLLKSEVYTIVIFSALILLIVALLWKEIKIVIFDPAFAVSLGISSSLISTILSILIVISIIIGLQTVGVILMSALLVAPGVAARQWTNKLSVMAVLAGLFGMVSGLIGTVISSSFAKIPTGPSIVMVISLIVLFSITLAPNRGLIWNAINHRQKIKNIGTDTVLVNIYQLACNHDDMTYSHKTDSLMPTLSRSKVLEKRLMQNLVNKSMYYRFTVVQIIVVSYKA